MNSQEDFLKSLNTPQKTNKSNNATLALKKYLFHWPLFLLAIGISLAVATLYLTFSKPVYTIKASILIKEDKSSASGDPQTAMLHEVGLASSSEGVENEISIIKSKQIIDKIVNDLQLWVTYIKKDGFLQTEDLYKNTPVKLDTLIAYGGSKKGVLEVKIKDSKTFLLKQGDDQFVELAFDKYHISDFGSWKLSPTKNIDQFKGSLIKIIIADRNTTTINYQEAIDANLKDKLSTSIDISINDVVPRRGIDILNSLISSYNISSTDEKNRETKSTLTFLDQRIDSLSKELTTSEKGIEGFKSSNGLTDISAQSQVQLQNMQLNDNNLNEVNIKLNVIDGVDKYVNSNQNSEKAPATVGIVDPALSNSIERLSLLQLQHDKLAATLPETNPDFEPINNQIKTAKAAIRENVKNIKLSLLATKQKLESINSGIEGNIKSMPEEERQYVSIKREQSSKEGLYTFLLQKREEVSVKYASNLANNRVVDTAYASPPQDKTSQTYLIALLCGVAIPVGLVYSRKHFNNKILSIDQINNELKAKVVCELPYEPLENSSPFFNFESSNAASEQLRALRMKLFYLHGEKENGRVTLVTSSVPSEGKSFISTSLASILTLAERKTLILELDMRKPKIIKSLGMSNDVVGMSDYLNKKATKEDIIQTFENFPYLSVISSGSPINNPSELLERKRLSDLLLELKAEYDDIIIDSPPVHLVSDAVILSRLAGVTLYVIRQGFTGLDELDFINQLIDQEQLKNVSVIFNGIDRVKHGYGYKYDENYYHKKKTNIFSLAFRDFKHRF
ncbi:GumC family protein [Mucilaginibacter sp.]